MPIPSAIPAPRTNHAILPSPRRCLDTLKRDDNTRKIAESALNAFTPHSLGIRTEAPLLTQIIQCVACHREQFSPLPTRNSARYPRTTREKSEKVHSVHSPAAC